MSDHSPEHTCILTIQADRPGGVPTLVDWWYHFLTGWGERATVLYAAFEDEHGQVETAPEAARIGAPVIELHTGAYCDAHAEGRFAERDAELARLREMSALAHSLGLEVHAGHGLTYDTVTAIARLPEVRELNIGHFLIGEAIFVGLPAAIGAQVAFPDKLVVDIAGDGSIQMNIQEMATAVQCCLPVKVAILNNGYLGMVRQWQELFYDKRYVCTDMNCAPDFVKLAEAFGAVGLRASKPQEVEAVIKEGLSVAQPVIMDFSVDREESVYPMVPAGAPITEMLLV